MSVTDLPDDFFGFDLSSIGALLTVAIVVIALLLVFRVSVDFLSVTKRISNQASINSGENLRVDRDAIDWGMLYPASEKNETVNVSNISPVPVELSFVVADWNPVNASDYISLSWNYTGSTVAASTTIPLTLTLHVSPLVMGIGNFTFTIFITGDEKT